MEGRTKKKRLMTVTSREWDWQGLQFYFSLHNPSEQIQFLIMTITTLLLVE